MEGALKGIVNYSFTLYGGDSMDPVECCAVPGRGSIIITGTEPQDVVNPRLTRRLPETYSNGRNDAVHSAALLSIFFLCNAEKEPWFGKLPKGERWFDIGRMMLMRREEITGKDYDLGLADLHIHYQNGGSSGAALMGASTALAIVQTMRGVYFGGHVAARAEVTEAGDLLPLHPLKSEITSTHVDLFLVPKPSCIPKVSSTMQVAALAQMEDMITYAYEFRRKNGGRMRKVGDATNDEAEDEDREQL